MKNRIHTLAKDVVGKIAAGEVVERPSSVVKELVENSIDAGATKISVELRGGGRDLIRVKDNGCGMSEDDALLSLERHTTSKIKEASDITNINTLGFRGEALPSIASVSKMELISRASGAEAGVRIEIDSGTVKNLKKTGCLQGTSVTVENLFFNVPARRKFLKTIPTEMSHIINILSHEAVAREEISFELTHNKKKILNVPAGKNFQERILYLYGGELAENLMPCDDKLEWSDVSGMIGKADYSRSQSNMMVFLVNKRPVRSKLLIHAALDGYRPHLKRDRYPAIFLFVRISPLLIDVNIHPQKTEVKFLRSNEVHSFISDLVRKSLAKPSYAHHLTETSLQRPGKETRIKEAIESYISSSRRSDAGLEREKFYRAAVSGVKWLKDERASQELIEKAAKDEIDAEREKIRNYKFLAQVHRTYIIAEGEDGMVVIDQHAAHERILYERLKEEFKKAQISSQRLLIPFTVEPQQAGAILVRNNLELFTSSGFDIEDFGENTFTLRAVPLLLKRAEPKQLFLELVDDLLAVGKIKDPAELRDKMITMMACRGAVKAGDKLDENEAACLIRDLADTASPNYCPHGRPAIIKLPLQELEKSFKRT